MWKPFNRSPQPSDVPAQSAPAPASVEETGEEVVRASIAEIELMGRTAVATLTVTELTQECGAEQLSDLLLELAETGAQHFVLDVQNVQFMDTACLGCLVEALNRLAVQGGRIAVVNPNHSVHYIFRLTRLDRVFRICSDVMAALEAVEQNKVE
jgi:anti-sigma B factor antagonist